MKYLITSSKIMNSNSKIFVAGHRGLVGSAILKNLEEKGYTNIITKSRSELDLGDNIAVANFFEEHKPEYVFLAAAKVGGIMANNVYRAQFIYENLLIQNNVIHQSYIHGVKKLLFLGSSCVYPKSAQQPIKEDYLLTDILEYTNEPYAVAKIAGMKMCEAYNLQYNTNFISVMPTNLYGPNDNFHLENSHVLPALLRKMHLAKLLEEGNFKSIATDLEQESSFQEASEKDKESNILAYLHKYGIDYNNHQNGESVTIKLWGSGNPLREFLWSDDMADACVYIMEHVDFAEMIKDKADSEIRNTHINIGWGKDISIKDLAYMIKQVVGFKGELLFDSNKPDGTMRKLLDTSRLSDLGWKPEVKLDKGIKMLYESYCNSKKYQSM